MLDYVPWRESWKYGAKTRYERELGSWELHFKECAKCRKEWSTKRDLIPYKKQVAAIEEMALRNHPKR